MNSMPRTSGHTFLNRCICEAYYGWGGVKWIPSCKLCFTVADESSQWTMLTGNETILEQKLSVTQCQTNINEGEYDLAASDTDEKHWVKHNSEGKVHSQRFWCQWDLKSFFGPENLLYRDPSLVFNQCALETPVFCLLPIPHTHTPLELKNNLS